MSFPRYEAYKDSGKEWLGEVPEHWKILPMRRGILFLTDYEANGSFADTKKAVKLDEGEPYAWYVRATDLEHSRHGIVEGNRFCNKGTYDFLRKTSLNGNELLVAKRGEIGKVYLMPETEYLATLAPNLYLLKLNESLKPNFAHYWLLSDLGRHQLEIANKSTTIGALYKDDVREVLCVFPPSYEQSNITRFLDHETARIDTLIAEQQRLIELLKEKRQAVISHAVTKGLDPTVPMKDSGVEWLGEVPKHWDVKKFGHISIVVRGSSPRPAGDPELFSGNYSPWVTVAEITKNDEIYLSETETCLTEKGSSLSRVFAKGTLLLSNSGATLGVPKILQVNANANDGVVGFEHLQLNHEFAYFYLSTLTADLRERIKQGSGQPNLNIEIVRSIPVPIPPTNEVTEIISFITKAREQFNLLTEEAENGILLLQERRSALISAAVTGKIDVRGWQAPASASPTDC